MLSFVTGASRGIGLEYARTLARDYGSDLLIVSSREEDIQSVAADIASDYGVNVIPVALDLAVPDAAERLFAYVQEQGLEVDVLVNNAGVFFFNPLTETDMTRIERLLTLHVLTVTKLCRLFGEQMCRRGSGYILNMSSLSTWMMFPGIQTYNASKSYLYNFSRSLWYEFKPKGVHVMVVTPGMVDTTLYGLKPELRALAVRLGINTPPERLARKALRRLFRRRKSSMPGLVNHIAKPFLKHLPDALVFAVMKRIAKYQK